MKRTLFAGILGGIVMFVWTSFAHLVLPLGEAGIKELPNESGVLEALQTNLGVQRGLYIFPGLGLGENPTHAERQEAMKRNAEKIATNPSGLLMYFPAGRDLNMGRLLGVEFGTELLEALLVVGLLAQTQFASFVGRVSFVTVAGIIAAIATNVSYWNWYGFPARYTAGYMFIQLVGFFLIGIVATLVFGKKGPGSKTV